MRDSYVGLNTPIRTPLDPVPPAPKTGKLRKYRTFHDAWAAFLYIGLMICVLTLGIFNLALPAEKGPSQSGSSQIPIHYTGLLLAACGGFALFLLLILVTLHLCTHYTKQLIYTAFGLQIFACLLLLFTGNIAIIMSCLISLAASCFIFFYTIRPSMAYICALISAAAYILSCHKRKLVLVTIVSFSTIVAQIVVIRLAFNNGPTTSALAPLLILSTFTVFWSLNIVLYIMQVIVTSIVVGHIHRDESMEDTVFADALYNTMRAFGTICFGALVIAVVQTLRSVVRSHQDRQRNERTSFGALLLYFILLFILELLESIAAFINLLVFSYVAVHGTPYVESVQKSFSEATDHGFRGLATLYCIDWLCSFFAIAYIIIVVALGALCYFIGAKSFSMGPLALKSFLLDYILFNIIYTLLYSMILSMLSSAALGLIFSKIEFSFALDNYNRELGNTIEAEARKRNPDAAIAG